MSKYLGGVLHLGTIDVEISDNKVTATEEQEKILLSILKKLEKDEDIKQILVNVYDVENDNLYKNVIGLCIRYDDRSTDIIFKLEDMNNIVENEGALYLNDTRIQFCKDVGASPIWHIQHVEASLSLGE